MKKIMWKCKVNTLSKNSPLFKKRYCALKTKQSWKTKRFPIKKFKKIEREDGKEIWQVYEVDAIFSTQIRMRDGRCMKCGSLMFQTCSHFFKRAIYSTRFDPENCDDLCIPCHEEWEGDPEGKYMAFKITQLGYDRFVELEERAKLRISPTEAVIKFMESVGSVKDNVIQY